ncbi:uncharacterized protein N7479_011397 [Penicillium vulpinum]|uniref:Uncharacterized protein n=1 Tax=Penicillium vulpinum TaxID=29845 RepID=A0A1V6RY11_9EURO|nr:uncharacterized protein N7479_011397 [Penicillium vulpinum]KAJ5952984.1 hypothetical protein N7479_011397 [Penicillium vulpinum]OQE06313.1 hypothetical protein PENVUL_c018G01320 [Penicillium vulpinum]
MNDWLPRSHPSRLSVNATKVEIWDCIQSLKNVMHSILRGHGDGTRGFTMLWPTKRGTKVTLCMDTGSYGQLAESARRAKEKRAVVEINQLEC